MVQNRMLYIRKSQEVYIVDIIITCSDPRHFLEMVRRVSNRVGELSRSGTWGLGEVSEARSSGSGKPGLERLGRMNMRTWTGRRVNKTR